jgi:hypothetical protein
MAKKVETQVLKKSTSSTSSQSILLEEYRALHSDYIQQRSEGVTRMNFFITAMSVVLGSVLIFVSKTNATTIPFFSLILLAALLMLATIGLDVYGFLIQRNIDIDRDIRGMARIRNHFVNLDPDLEKVFVVEIKDTSSNYLIAKGSGMRRSLEIIVGFLVGTAAVVLSSYISLKLEIKNIVIGVGMTIVTALFLEFIAQRKLKKEIIFYKDVNAE